MQEIGRLRAIFGHWQYPTSLDTVMQERSWENWSMFSVF